ncbi:MAG: hypothetical protein ACTSVI_16820 [Promethearchaeota archaeon]
MKNDNKSLQYSHEVHYCPFIKSNKLERKRCSENCPAHFSRLGLRHEFIINGTSTPCLLDLLRYPLKQELMD